uniref:Uncharacterized protein n=1 Tax=Kalmanozyma brasiliensis (strain GHG001) TaxID=1365824 RepID=V5F039_KALBG
MERVSPSNGSAKSSAVKWYMVALFFLLAVAGATTAQDVADSPSDIYALINSICDITDKQGLASGCGLRHVERLHKRGDVVQIIERGTVDQDAFDNLDHWAEVFGKKFEPYDDDDNIRVTFANTMYLVTNHTADANARRSVVRRDGEAKTLIDTSHDRVETGTRSIPYDFGVSSGDDCNQLYCSGQGNGGLTGTTDMGRLVQISYKNQYVCQSRRATARIQILGEVVDSISLVHVKETMKALLEREQTGEIRDVCYDNARWKSTVWKTVPSANVRHILPSGQESNMLVTVDLQFERNNEFSFICSTLLSFLGELPGGGAMGQGISALVGCNN